MAQLCDSCEQQTPVSYIGHCAKCSKTTDSFNFKLCDECAEELDECAWCRGPLDGTGSHQAGSSSSGAFFITARDADNGQTFKGCRIGEEVHVELTEDRWSGKEWAVKSITRGVVAQYNTSIFIQDPNDYQYGARQFVFDLLKHGTAEIELYEVQRSYGWWGGGGGTSPVKNGKTYKITVEIK